MSALLRLALLGAGRAAGAVLGSLAAIVLARDLSPQALGVWSLALAVQGYALHLGEFGLRSVVTAEAARTEGPIRPLLARYLTLRLAISGGLVLLTAVGTALLAPAAAPIVPVAVASILAAVLQLDWLALADDRPGLAAGLLLVRPLAFLLALLAWPDRPTPASVALLFLLAWIVAAVVSWVALVRPAPTGRSAPPASQVLLRAGAPLCAVTFLNQALLSGDLLLAGACLGTAAAGHYYVASQVAVAGLVVANAAGQMALARLARHAPDSPGFAAALVTEMRPVLGCGMAMVLALLALAPWLLPQLFGPAQAPAVPLLLALLPWLFLQHPTTLLQGALAAIGRGDRALRGNLVMLLVMVPALGLAAACGSLTLFALARAVGEAARLAALLHALPAGARRRLGCTMLASLRPRARPGTTRATQA